VATFGYAGVEAQSPRSPLLRLINGVTSSGTSLRIEVEINRLWNSIALSEETTMPYSEILDQVRKALEFHHIRLSNPPAGL
jgi:hypothetical protein